MRADGRLARADHDAVLPVAIGTGLWLVVLAVLVLRRDSLAAAGNGWWILAAAAGALSGALGLVFLRWRRTRRTGSV
ncbi:MAG: DUF2530 domain-containing protein [Candidatus Nanopelagicales bacterium]